MNEKLLGLLRKKESLLRDRMNNADAANKSAYIAKEPIPYSQEVLVEMELDMLQAQIELAREEGTDPITEKRGG